MIILRLVANGDVVSPAHSDLQSEYVEYKDLIRYPGHAKYCDLGHRNVSDFHPTQACNFYRF